MCNALGHVHVCAHCCTPHPHTPLTPRPPTPQHPHKNNQQQPLVWDALRPAPGGAQRESEAREKYEPGFVPNNSPMSYHQVGGRLFFRLLALVDLGDWEGFVNQPTKKPVANAIAPD